MKRDTEDAADDAEPDDLLGCTAELVVSGAEALAPRPPADWYQDSPLVTLPVQCQPNWRTIH